MFQPQPTPYSTYASYGIHIANAEVPEYAFQPTPLGQFGTGHAGAGAGTGAGGGPTTTADIFASPIFHNPNPLIPTNNPNHLSYNSIPHNHHHHPNHRNIKMESQHPNDLAAQEAAAREFKPQQEVSSVSASLLFFSHLFPLVRIATIALILSHPQANISTASRALWSATGDRAR